MISTASQPSPADSFLDSTLQSITSAFGISFVVLIVVPAVVVVIRFQSVIRTKARVSKRHRRYRTYVVLERAWREMKSDFPIAQELILSPTALTDSEARALYEATPQDGDQWRDKVMITHLLEKLERLATGVNTGAIDPIVWQGMSGHEVTTLCSSLRSYIKVSEERRKDRYGALREVEQIFQRLTNEQTLAETTSERAAPLLASDL